MRRAEELRLGGLRERFEQAPADEPLASASEPHAEPWKVVIVDDEQEVHDVTLLALRKRAELARLYEEQKRAYEEISQLKGALEHERNYLREEVKEASSPLVSLSVSNRCSSVAWALTTEELSGPELAAQLQHLPPGVETVVISACCHGRELRLHDAVRAPLIHISTARYVMRSAAPSLVTELIAAAEQNLSYRELEARFRRDAYSGRELHIDARPAELDLAVLAEHADPGR